MEWNYHATLSEAQATCLLDLDKGQPCPGVGVAEVQHGGRNGPWIPQYYPCYKEGYEQGTMYVPDENPFRKSGVVEGLCACLECLCAQV